MLETLRSMMQNMLETLRSMMQNEEIVTGASALLIMLLVVAYSIWSWKRAEDALDDCELELSEAYQELQNERALCLDLALDNAALNAPPMGSHDALFDRAAQLIGRRSQMAAGIEDEETIELYGQNPQWN